ncbi:MAG: ATP-binding protein [Opitutales bacterium]
MTRWRRIIRYWIHREGGKAVVQRAAGTWVFLVFLALLPIGLLSLLAFRTATQSVRELVQANNLSAAMVAADLVGEDLQRSLRLNRSLAESSDFIQAVERRSEEEVRTRLRSVLLLYPLMDRAFVTDSEGTLWSDYPPAPESLGRNFAHRDWYIGMSREWEPYISEVYKRHAEPQVLVVAVAVPVHNEDRQVIGALVSQYSLDGISEGLRQVKLGESGTVFLLDPNGVVAAHPELDLRERVVRAYSSLEPVQLALEGRSHTAEYRDPLSDVSKVATFIPVTIAERDWVVVAEQPTAEAYAPIRRIAMHITAAGSIFALAAVAVVMGLWRISERNRKLNLELERRNAALQKTTAELERSNQELEQFAYVASHDLQEPLRMVASYTQLLGRRYQGRLDNKADKYIHYAVDGAKRMQALIQDLLKYSRVGTRAKPFEPTDMSEIFERALSNLKITIKEENAVVTADAMPTLMADPTQMTQLFQNLIGNAIKFRREEPPRVHVSVRRKGDEWVFSVSDNGVGIAPEFFENIFIIFQRLPNNREVSGTGLGLSVCKKIIERHGGRIWVESKEGEGSTFHFTIPDKPISIT